MKLFDSELKVMEILWEGGEMTAKEIAQALKAQVGWNKNTTYTVIKKLIDKEAIARREPGFVCSALVTRREAQAQELGDLIDRMFGGSEALLFASLLDRRGLPRDEADRLRRLVTQEDGDA